MISYLTKTGALFSLFFFFTIACFAQIQFTENKGQWNKSVSYKSDIENGAFFLQKNGFTVLLHDAVQLQKLSAFYHGHDKLESNSKPLVLKSHAYKVSFAGIAMNTSIAADKLLPGYSNYFQGEDKNTWQGGCHSFESVVYKNVYPGIDVHYYVAAGKIKYDIIVHPGGNVNNIRLQYDGVNNLSVQNKELVIGTSIGALHESAPYTYQAADQTKKTISCNYSIKKNVVGFDVGQYDPTTDLVIDPTLLFCSLTGSTADNWGYTSTPGPDGSLFAGGTCFANGYPVSTGAFQQTFGGGVTDDPNGPYDIAIFKFSPNGNNRLYATYLGGSGNEQPQSMIADAQGNLIVTGRTNSSNFPKSIAAIGPGGKYDIFVTKFNVAGTGLTGSIVIGGSEDDGMNIKGKYTVVSQTQPDGAVETRRNYGDDARSEVILDAANNIYLAGSVQSTNFPVVGNVLQPSFAGGRQDGIIIKFNAALSAITFSSFFGGTGSDACCNAFINPANNNLYISGATTSSNLPGDKTGVVNPVYSGGETDGFITQMSTDGSAIIKTTYIGTTGNDMLYGLQIDDAGFPYITGATTGSFPVINAGFSNVGSKQFIAKLQRDLSAYVYSTVFGTNSSSPNISPTAFNIDNCGNVSVIGWGGTFNNFKGYPCAGTNGLPVTSNALKSATDGNDFYIFVLQKNAASQLYGSFFGQNGGFDDHADGGTSRFDHSGILYQAECANCGRTAGVIFPTTGGAWATTNGSNAGCNEAAIKMELNFGGVTAGLKALFNGNPANNICTVPASIQFTDTLAKGKRYTWNFGDGSAPVTTLIPNNFTSHNYTTSGTFRATVTAIDSATCNVADTALLFVKINTCNQSCAAAVTIYRSDLSGNNYQWQVNTGTGFTNLNNSSIFSGVNTAQLSIANAPTSWYGNKYRCIVDGNAGNVFSMVFVNYWLGTVSNAWENPQNWSCGVVPDGFTDVVVNSGTVTLNSNTTVAAITVTPGAHVIVNPAYQLILLGH